MAKGTADGGAATTTPGQEKLHDIVKASGKSGGGGGVPAMAAGEEQLVIRAPVHCDGCARKLRRSLQRLQGVGEVTVDSRSNTVVVRGRTAVENAAEVVQVVERKTGEKAAVVVSPSPSPEKLLPPKGGSETNKKGDATSKDTTSELPEVDMEMVTVLKMNLHCDGCSEEIKRRILKITGVEEAVPHLKSSQLMVKGKVEPATLVGFIHRCTGRRAAIIRAAPLDDRLLPQPPSSSPAPPPVESESKKDSEPPENNPLPGEERKKKNGGGRQNGKKEKKEEPNEQNKGGRQEDDEDHVETEKPSDDGGHGAAAAAAEEHGGAHGREAPNNNNGGHGDGGLVLENHTKDDRLFTVPMPAGVVTVAPEMALSNRSYYYYPVNPCAQYYYPYNQYQYPPQAYACSPASMSTYGYGYGYPASYPSPEAFSEENPNACTIV